MTDDYRGQVMHLLASAKPLKHGVAKTALLREAVGLADFHCDVKLGFVTRKRFMTAAFFGGAEEEALVAFSWCLSWCDREPARFPETELLWEYKWMLSNSSDNPKITLPQIEAMFVDAERRYQRSGRGLRPLYRRRCAQCLKSGEFQAAAHWQDLWQQSPVDKGNDCAVCDRHHRVFYALRRGDDEVGVREATAIIQGGMKCTVIPHVTLASVLLPLVGLGRLQEAAWCHRWGYRLIADNPNFLASVARHLNFLTVTENLESAIRVFEKHLPWCAERLAPAAVFECYQAARFLLKRLQASNQDVVAVRWPESLSNPSTANVHRTIDLQTWFDGEAQKLAAQFDARNGNSYFEIRLGEPEQWTRLITPFPLKPSRPLSPEQQPLETEAHERRI